jgi:hypothetical protein
MAEIKTEMVVLFHSNWLQEEEHDYKSLASYVRAEISRQFPNILYEEFSFTLKSKSFDPLNLGWRLRLSVTLKGVFTPTLEGVTFDSPPQQKPWKGRNTRYKYLGGRQC